MSKPGRNDPCRCGSGKKYKKCCLSKDDEEMLVQLKEIELGEAWDPEEEPVKWPEIIDAQTELEDVDSGEGDDEDDEDSYSPFGKGEDEGIPSVKDSPYPAISKDEEKIVDEWWEMYKKMDDNPDKIRRLLQEFIDKYSPEMVENLGMEHEILFELGAAYYRADRHGEYIQLLMDIRFKYPEVYRRSASFYDADIITWLIANKRDDEIYDYLNYFENFPDDFVDELFGVINLLQAKDNTQPLIALVKKVHQRITTSPKVFGGRSIISPLVTHIMSGYLRPDFTDAELEQMLKELTEEFNDEFEGIDFWKTGFGQIFRPFEQWDESTIPKKMKMEEKYRAISFNYTRYLHAYKNISWVSAHYYSQLMLKYFFQYIDLSKNQPKTLFNFKKEMIDKIAGKLTAGFIFSDIVKAVAILNTIWYFQEYLHLCGNLDETRKKIIQEDCLSFYNDIYCPWRKKDIEALCFPKFPFWD